MEAAVPMGVARRPAHRDAVEAKRTPLSCVIFALSFIIFVIFVILHLVEGMSMPHMFGI